MHCICVIKLLYVVSINNKYIKSYHIDARECKKGEK